MLVSLNGLRRFVEITESPQEVSVALTSLGFEVESLKVLGEGVTGVVVAEVRQREKHPEADKLSVCNVFDGEQEVQVVCGAANVAAGQKVLFAKVGAKLPGGFAIKRAKLRGVESLGMICAEDEVGLGSGHDGILVLPAETPTGLALAKIPGLCDSLFEVNVTPNRPDALSHIGLARELAAKWNRSLTTHLRTPNETTVSVNSAAKIQVEDGAACPRYVGRVIEGVTVGESPAWLKSALQSLGKNPINNIVDITNFVLLEYGQPSHAFDLDTLAGNQVVVRRAHAGEALTTLDGVERVLSEQDLVIADAEKAQVLAGVMGGVASGVSTATRRIFLEVAYFQPAFVRLQARRHGLSSDSSYRFERGVDPLCTSIIADHLAALIAEVAGGKVLAGRLETISQDLSLQQNQVTLRPERIRKLLGISVPDAKIQSLLTGIGLGLVEHQSDVMVFSIPGFRGDLTREADLMEEVARLVDYNTIPGTLPRFPMGAGGVPPREALSREIRHTLSDLGLNEALHLRFTSRKQLAKLGLAEGDSRLNPVLLQNPLSEEWEAMPTTVLPNLLQSLLHNQNNQQSDAALFEISKTFFPRAKTHPRDNGVLEDSKLGLAMMGSWPRGGAGEEDAALDFYSLKGLVENLFRRLGRVIEFKSGTQEPFLHPNESCTLIAPGKAGETLGWFGMLHPQAQLRFDLKQTIGVAEISLDAFLKLDRAKPQFQAFSTQVAATRDFNAIADETVRHGEILSLIPKMALLESLRLRSIYRGQGVPEGQKAMHYEVVYRHAERSLTDDEVQKAHETVKSALMTDTRIRFKG